MTSPTGPVTVIGGVDTHGQTHHATVIARSMGSDAAATFPGHTSTAITEGHYIEPDHTVDPTPATHLKRTLRPHQPDAGLLAMAAVEGEEEVLALVDDDPGEGAVA